MGASRTWTLQEKKWGDKIKAYTILLSLSSFMVTYLKHLNEKVRKHDHSTNHLDSVMQFGTLGAVEHCRAAKQCLPF